MPSEIREAVFAFHGDHPLLFYLIVTVIFFSFLLLALTEYFKPVGKRRCKDGKPAVLPPGPYGEMATLHLGSKTWIFLNSNRVVSELIAKRGSATNQRTPMPVSSGIISHGDRRSVLMMQEDWAEPRRLKSTQMLAEYLLKPKLWYRHHYRYANSVIHRIALGERLAKSTKELEDMQNCVIIFVGNIGHSIRLEQCNYDVYREWWVPARDKVLAGTAPPSFICNTLLHGDTKYTDNDVDAMYAGMQLIEAGSDTTREALNVIVMAALEYPEAFHKARAEVDRVCGTDADARLPTLADMDNLGYICAMAKEGLRWHPIFVTTPDHTASKDIDFEGYHFPAGVGFIINQNVVCDDCESPEKFYPERWMNGHESDITHGLWQFGGGRRVCVKYRFAQRSLLFTISRLRRLLTTLNLKSTNEPFPIKVTVHNQHYGKLIIEQAERAGVLEDAKLARDKL
ncbi:cytochrome P450 [Bombardia bombarda]|uniref:Cytochrome P450 n=1 Tax=Bombardia bombarda TaxID=252184 RepID=A0AA39XJN8_9PEZI|nr:cytochrome P450 [Bombardia bombarda]